MIASNVGVIFINGKLAELLIRETRTREQYIAVLIEEGYKSVADLGRAQGTRAPPLGTQILSISCSFWGNLAKSYVGAPPPGVSAPSWGKSWTRHCYPPNVTFSLQKVLHVQHHRIYSRLFAPRESHVTT